MCFENSHPSLILKRGLAGDLQMYHDVPLVADSFVVWDPPTGPSNWGYVWQFFGVSRNYGTMVIKAISWDMGSLTTVFFFYFGKSTGSLEVHLPRFGTFWGR